MKKNRLADEITRSTTLAQHFSYIRISDPSRYEYAQNLVVLGINFQESKEAILAFLEDKDLSVKSLMDPEALVAKTYQVDALPTQILIDQEGRLMARHIGLFPSVRKLFRPIIKKLLDESQN